MLYSDDVTRRTLMLAMWAIMDRSNHGGGTHFTCFTSTIPVQKVQIPDAAGAARRDIEALGLLMRTHADVC